jgi:hypothetical protein
MLADLLHAPDPYLSLGYSIVKSRRSANLTPSAVMFGGAGGTRTPDFRLAKAALSQLSYGPASSPSVVGDGGLEPPTSVLSGPRSNQLS